MGRVGKGNSGKILECEFANPPGKTYFTNAITTG
jgi:hypothetical protein